MDFNERFDVVRLMHETMLSMNNEDAYMAWIWLMPDEPTTEDFVDFTDAYKFEELETYFSKLYDRYREDGLFEPSDEVLAFLKARGYQLENVDIFHRRGVI